MFTFQCFRDAPPVLPSCLCHSCGVEVLHCAPDSQEDKDNGNGRQDHVGPIEPGLTPQACVDLIIRQKWHRHSSLMIIHYYAPI